MRYWRTAVRYRAPPPGFCFLMRQNYCFGSLYQSGYAYTMNQQSRCGSKETTTGLPCGNIISDGEKQCYVHRDRARGFAYVPQKPTTSHTPVSSIPTDSVTQEDILFGYLSHPYESEFSVNMNNLTNNARNHMKSSAKSDDALAKLIQEGNERAIAEFHRRRLVEEEYLRNVKKSVIGLMNRRITQPFNRQMEKTRKLFGLHKD